MKRIAAWLLRPSRAAALLALALTALLYGDALRLPLFSDDLVQIPWLESVTWRALWTAPSPYGYYRPLWYSLWRVWAALTGGLTPLGLHLLNLLAHALAAWLAGLLAADWACAEGDQPARPAVLGTLFFALFPFAVQAVAWPGAVYNPLVSAMVAGALLAYTRGRGHSDARSRGRWLALALLLVVLAPFTYEEGLLAAPALALCEVAGWLRPRCLHRRCLHRRCLHRRCLRRLTRLAAFAALTVGTLAVWRLARGAGVTGFGLSPADLRRNAAYLVQALVYPAAPLGQRIAESLGLEAELALGLAALPCLAALLWAGLRRSVSATVLGLGWFVLFALPPAVTMAADWFALAPRFLYMTAAGTALLWTLAVEAALDWLQGRAERAPRPRLAQAGALALAGVIVAALLTPAVCFVRRGMALYTMTGQTLWAAVEAAEQQAPLLFVNLPSSVEPTARTYPMGFEGVAPLPKRVAASQLIYVHTGQADAASALRMGVAATDAPPGYTYQVYGQPGGYEELLTAARQARAVYVARYHPEAIPLVEVGAVGVDVEGAPLARFEGGLELLAASAACDAGGQVQVRLDWRTPQRVETDVSVFAHLLDEGDALAAQADGYPLAGMAPFWLWQSGETVRDVRTLAAGPGRYRVRLGLWEPATGRRWAVEGAPDGLLYLPVDCP